MEIYRRNLSNSERVLYTFIRSLNVKVSMLSCISCLNKHPDYPGILAFDDCLSSWGINNQAFKISKANYSADNLLFPFIAQLAENEEQFILVHQIANGNVIYSNEKNSKKILPEDTFLNLWNGVGLYAEADGSSGETNYITNQIQYFIQRIQLPVTFIVLVAIIYLIIGEIEFSWPLFLLGLSKYVGLVICIILLLQSISSDNPIINRFCSLGKKNNCNNIIRSDAAKITHWLSWSEIGFYYFSGSLLFLVINPTGFSFLALLNILALPYTLYSISYQYRTKEWCILCSSVQVIIWIECATLAYRFDPFTFNKSLSIFGFSLLILCILIPIVIWSYLKPIIVSSVQLKETKQILNKFKCNQELFKTALKNQSQYTINDELMPVLLGNPQAETIITLVSNPFCKPCSVAHKTLDEWLKHRGDLQLRVLFAVPSHDDELSLKVAEHITALNLSTDKGRAVDALNSWFQSGNKSYDVLAIRYPASYNDNVSSVMQNQRRWCEMAEINFTPTILINGYKLPEPYTLEDMKYLLA